MSEVFLPSDTEGDCSRSSEAAPYTPRRRPIESNPGPGGARNPPDDRWTPRQCPTSDASGIPTLDINATPRANRLAPAEGTIHPTQGSDANLDANLNAGLHADADSHSHWPKPSHERTPIRASFSTLNVDHKSSVFASMAHREVQEYAKQVSVDYFSQKFLPSKTALDEGTKVKIQQTLSAGIKNAKRESEMYPVICTALNSVLSASRSEYIMKDTADRREDEYADHKPDLTMFHKKTGVNSWSVSRPTKLGKGKPWDKAKVGFAWCICVMEVKYRKEEDPFGTDDEDLTFPDSDRATRARQQILRYAIEMFLRQHRKFAFTVVIAGRGARLVLWDPAGVVVSQRFDYVKDATPLFDLVTHLSATNRAGQGFDTTVSLADGAQIEELQSYGQSTDLNEYQRSFVAEMLEDQDLYPIRQFQLENLDIPHRPKDAWCSSEKLKNLTLTLLIGKYRVRNYSPIGRSTKGYFAYVVGERRLLFVKVSWRPEAGAIVPEIERYEALYKASVPNIAILVGGGDTRTYHDSPHAEGELLRTRTGTQELLDIPKWYPRVQTRLAFETLGIPLSEYQESLSLIKVVYDAVKAHRLAWTKAGILHRDISIGNILIDISSPNMVQPKGILTDWDLSKDSGQLNCRTQHARSGTWAFMSGASLRYPLKPPSVADDLESFIHIIIFCTLRFHRTSLTNETTLNPRPNCKDYNKPLAKFVDSHFYEDIKEGRYHYGGSHKFAFYKDPVPTFRLLRETTAFHRLFHSLHDLCHQHYQSLNEDQLAQYSGREAPVLASESFVRRMGDTAIMDDYYSMLADSSAAYLEDVFGAPRQGAEAGPHSKPQSAPSTDPLHEHMQLLGHLAVALVSGDWEENDKIPDQFLHLPRFVSAHDKSNSFSFGSSKDSKEIASTVQEGRVSLKRSREEE